MNKVGIYGGSFDPIHLGHITLAQQAKDELKLNQVLFVPAKYQPFKLDRELSSDHHRIEMLKLAIAGLDGFKISYDELNKDEISYTIYTLMNIKNLLGKDTEFFFILGTDAFLPIECWYKSKELLENFSFAVGSRPGYKEEELKDCIERIRAVYNTNIILLNNRKLPISSTEIKKCIKARKSLENLVPKSVERYIHEQGLYQ